jgi:basic membrane protein A and related proteins
VNTMRKLLACIVLLTMVGMLLVACGATPESTQAPQPTQAQTQPTAAQAPTELNIAGITITAIEEPWNTAWLQTMNRIQAAKPHGLTINLEYTENVAPPDAERVLRQYAQTGKYQIIWSHSAYPDAVKVLKDEFPDIVWVLAGSGNEAFGGNAYLVDASVHEPAYLMGIIAGMMTKSNVIGAVGGYPYPNVNAPLNAFIAGAKSVNPNVDAKVTFISSWFDPPKAKESALAQIAAGADLLYAERFGPFEACQEKGILCFGHFVDQNDLAPEVVVSSTVARWDPDAMVVIDAWWDHVTKGTPYNAPTDRVMFSMKDGGSDLAPFHGFETKLPKDVVDAVNQAKADIMSGKLVVPLNEAPPGGAIEEPTAVPEVAGPTELPIASIFETSVEQPWYTSLLQAVDRLNQEKLHGVTITFEYTENVALSDAERVLRQYAESGKYPVIWAHSGYSDAVKNLKDEFPDILWVVTGSGNEGLGGNVYWFDVMTYEPAYLAGIVAGKMTKSNILGGVASFPYPNVNAPLNAFLLGAQSVNPNVTMKTTYIESWFDPTKAKESALAQISAGADQIYAERFGPFDACKEKGVLCYGQFVDQNSLAPDVVVTSPMALWDASLKTTLNAWWDHTTQGTPYNAPTDRIYYLMKDGGADLAPFYGFEQTLPKDVLDAVAQAKADILSGKLVVPLNEAPLESK